MISLVRKQVMNTYNKTPCSITVHRSVTMQGDLVFEVAECIVVTSLVEFGVHVGVVHAGCV